MFNRPIDMKIAQDLAQELTRHLMPPPRLQFNFERDAVVRRKVIATELSLTRISKKLEVFAT